MARGRKPEVKTTPKQDYDKVVQLISKNNNLEAAEEVAAVECPECPDWITGHARDHWYRIGPALAAKGRLETEDLPSFEILCRNYHEFRTATDAIDDPETGGRICTSRGRYGSMSRSRPEVAQMNEADRRHQSRSGDFGITPVGRQRVPETPGQGEMFRGDMGRKLGPKE